MGWRVVGVVVVVVVVASWDAEAWVGVSRRGRVAGGGGWSPIDGRPFGGVAPLGGKRAKKVDREDAWASKKAAEAQLKRRRAGRASDLAPAALQVSGGALIVEDHRFEQFFYDGATLRSMLARVGRFKKPLLVCNPSLAAAMPEGADFRLLDRDTRFQGVVPNYREFDLLKPEAAAVAGFDFDAIFIDPPFANVTPRQLADATRALLGSENPHTHKIPLVVGYNRRRAPELLEAFHEFGLRQTDTDLAYESGVMPDSICLFTNF